MAQSKDPIRAAKLIFDEFLSKADPVSIPDYDPDAKNLKAQAASLKGAVKGALARARSLTPQRRSQIAKKAAAIRWKRKD